MLAGCWAHVRRKFYEARDQEPKLSGWFLRQIQLLYQVEARLREANVGPDERAAARAVESRMVVERFHRVLLRVRSTRLPKSLLGTAIAYALGQWAGMTVFLGDGRVEIDSKRHSPAASHRCCIEALGVTLQVEDSGRRPAPAPLGLSSAGAEPGVYRLDEAHAGPRKASPLASSLEDVEDRIEDASQTGARPACLLCLGKQRHEEAPLFGEEVVAYLTI